jgi:polynucleotide 5'-hydroxyl-kinase GRC3/NOL9
VKFLPRLRVEAGKTLIVSGPASVSLEEGETQIFGAKISVGERITVRKWRILPIYCAKDSTLKVEASSEGSTQTYEGNTIPPQWWKASEKIVEKLRNEGKPALLAIIGGVDVGKTSLTVFLANRLLEAGFKVRVIDGDVGQSDIGPPCTIGSAQISRPIFDLFFVKPDKLAFAGSVTPAKVTGRILAAVEGLCGFCLKNADVTLLNTDGWISGEGADEYKVKLIKASKASLIIALQSSDELKLLIRRLEAEGFNVLKLPLSPVVRSRSRSERRELRWQAYRKYLIDATIRSLPVAKITSNHKPTLGAVVALYGSQPRRLLGLGIILSHNKRTDSLKILTPVKGFIDKVEVGETLVDFSTLKPKAHLTPSE